MDAVTKTRGMIVEACIVMIDTEGFECLRGVVGSCTDGS